MRALFLCWICLVLLSCSLCMCQESETITAVADSDTATSSSSLSPPSSQEDDESSLLTPTSSSPELSPSPSVEQSDETTTTKTRTIPIKKSPAKTVFTDLFGSSLYSWNTNSTASSGERRLLLEELSTSEVLREGSKDVVAVYFSASWCAPCRQFTPLLAQFYSTVNKKLGSKNVSDYNDRRFEVVWVSRDSSPDEFVQYYTQMPWLAVPFDKVGSG